MRSLGAFFTVLVVAALFAAGWHLGHTTEAERKAAHFAASNHTAYALPADKMQKAVALDHARIWLTVVETLWTPLQLWLILALGGAARMRDLAERAGRNRWLQCFVFVFLLLLAFEVLNLPLGIYAHHLGLRYGLSVQGWAGWSMDLAKMFALQWSIGGLLVMLMFWIIRSSPRGWWLWFAMLTACVVIAGVFASPYVIDPLFNQFEPLQKVDPALVAQLERVVARGGLQIPPDRMFLMKASAKSTEMNAYVTGFGASKRVVVWDTTIAKSSPDEIAFVFAHEMGHYALGHVALGTGLSCLGLLPFFWIGYEGLNWLLRRPGGRWGVTAQQDWGALVVLLLVLSVLATVSEPANNAISRRMEHDADVYGQEAVHGIVANPQEVGLRSFQELGEQSLDDPTPHPWFDFWFGTHPPIWFRAAFSEAYDPWQPGLEPRYFAK